MWKVLEKKGVRIAYIRSTNDIYEGTLTSVRMHDGVTDDFYITSGFHKGSTLSLYFFTVILDVLTEHIKELAPRCMLFANDVVLVDLMKELNERLEIWRQALEVYDFHVGGSKT